MKIETANHLDADELVKMIMSIQQETSYRETMKFDPDRVKESINHLIDFPMGIVFVAKDEDRLVGSLGALAHFHPISGEFGAGELFWWVHPDYRHGHKMAAIPLYLALVKWTRESGGKWLQMTAPYMKDDLGEGYEALGFQKIEIGYQRRIQ